MNLIRTPNMARPDDVFEALLALHEGRSDDESELLNAELLFVLINHIGDEDVIEEAVTLVASMGRRRCSLEQG